MAHGCHCPKCTFLHEHGYNPKHVIETSDTTVTVETKGQDPVDFPLSFKDTGLRCETPVTYKVVPYDYSHMAGRKGVMYQIVEQHFLASSKSQEGAQHIVDKLNSVRRMEKDLDAARFRARRFEREAEVLRNRGPTASSMEMVRNAVADEISELKHARWSSHRKAVVDFAKSVLKRLGIDDDCRII